VRHATPAHSRVLPEAPADEPPQALNLFGPNGPVARYYYPFPPTAGSDGAVVLAAYYTFDPQGNVFEDILETSPQNDPVNGKPYDLTVYDAYGNNLLDLNLPTGNPESEYRDPFGFGGQWGYYTDPETGLDLLGHRYYDPSAGRFLTRDPIGYAGGINLYGFAGNNPVTGTDPDGTSPNGFQRWWHKHITEGIASWFSSSLTPGTATLTSNAAEHQREIAEIDANDDGAWVNDEIAAQPANHQIENAARVRAGIQQAYLMGASMVPVGSPAGEVALDADALIAYIEGSDADGAAVMTAMAGRTPVVSMTAAKQFLKKGSATALRDFLGAFGGRILPAPSAGTVRSLIARGVQAQDARVAGSAIDNGIQLITRDSRLLKKIGSIGIRF
jgi:RHS repeat-associated protein